MKYNGIELEPITKVQAFEGDKQREMYFWMNGDGYDGIIKDFCAAIVQLDADGVNAVSITGKIYDHVAEIPEIEV